VSFTDATPGGGTESFLNVQAYPHWYGEGWGNNAFNFDTVSGSQHTIDKGLSSYSWLVHDGDIGASPVPLPAGIYLFLSGLVSLGLMRGRYG
jgi:hypothetical protein